MKRTLLLPLLLLVSAAPATRPGAPAVERLVVRVRHVEYALKPGDASVALPADEVPADARELSSLQVSASADVPFETVAVIGGTTYRLAGTLKRSAGDADHVAVELDYAETAGDVVRNVSQIKSRVVVTLERPHRIGGMSRGATATAMVLTVARAAP